MPNKQYVVFCDSEHCRTMDFGGDWDVLEDDGWQEIEGYTFCQECVIEMIGKEDGARGGEPEVPHVSYLLGYRQGLEGDFSDDLS